MRSVTIKGKRRFEVTDIEEPKSERGKITIEVVKSGICGSDIHYWESGNPKGLIMGHEFSGKVIDSTDSEFNVGDRVTALPISPCWKCSACLSGNVQYCPETWSHAVGLSLDNPGALTSRINVRTDMVLKLPDNVSYDEGAMVEPTAVSLHAIHLADIKVGAKVLVIGGGIIGLGCAMFAKLEGAGFVALSETNERRGKKAVELDAADCWYDAKDQNSIAEMLTKTGGGFDVVVECVGNSPAVNSALTLVKPGGTVVLVGVSTKAIDTYTTIAVMKELKVLGAIAYTKEEFKTCIELISNKQIDVCKFISKEVGLDDVQSAYEELTSGNTNSIKILVNPSK